MLCLFLPQIRDEVWETETSSYIGNLFFCVCVSALYECVWRGCNTPVHVCVRAQKVVSSPYSLWQGPLLNLKFTASAIFTGQLSAHAAMPGFHVGSGDLSQVLMLGLCMLPSAISVARQSVFCEYPDDFSLLLCLITFRLPWRFCVLIICCSFDFSSNYFWAPLALFRILCMFGKSDVC